MTTAIASAMKHLAAAASAALLAALLMAPAAALAAPATTSQGIGPYEIEMPSATFNAQLLRRDGDTIWLRRVGPDGTLGPQIGYEHTDIVRVNMPPPGFFSNLYALVDAPTPPPASTLIRAEHTIDKFVETTAPFRDLPGIVSDEGIYLKAKLLDAQHKYEDALQLYDSLRSMDPPSTYASNALIRAGIDYQRTTNALECISCLSGVLLPEDDENLLSDLLFALGDAFLDVGNYDNALQTYLTLVVFYPYVRDNEPRALAKVLPCYAALKEWEPLYRTIQDIRATYPDSPASAAADAILKEHGDELAKAGLMVTDGARIVDDAEETALQGTTAATDAPEHTQLNP